MTDKLITGEIGHLDEDFEASFEFIRSQPITWVHKRLVKLGSWPYERLPIRILSNVEAAERLKNRNQASLAVIRAVTCIEAHDGRLYLVKTVELATGIRVPNHNANDERVRARVKEMYSVTLDGS